MKKIFEKAILIAGVFGIMNLSAQTVVGNITSVTKKDLLNGVMVKKSTIKVDEGKAYRIFELNVEQSGNYFLSAWLMGTQTSKGDCVSYEVLVNDKKLSAKFTPSRSGWQDVYLRTALQKSSVAVPLVKGYNKVVLVAILPEVPDVEFLKVASTESVTRLDVSEYSAYISSIRQEMYQNATSKAVERYFIDNDTTAFESTPAMLPGSHTFNNPEGNYNHRVNVPFGYTTYKTYHFNAGQQVFVATSATNNYRHVLEMFNKENPFDYSWVNLSNLNNLASLNITIPVTGVYYVRVRAYIQNSNGVVNLNVNGQYYFRDCPVSGNGFAYRHSPTEVLNYFTCNSIGDPHIWIERQNGLPGTIVDQNDDYRNGGGEYNWNLNSRIKKNIGTPIAAVLVSSHSSFTPIGKCDIYMGCRNSDIMSYFPYLNNDDAIQSAPYDRRYNCTSWAGGITWGWFWGSLDTDPNLNYGNPSIWRTWDNYFGNTPFPRYIGATNYTTIGANANNAVVAMWALNGSITHGSVRGYANRHPHGYDWESKPGRLMRTFHPRDALRGSAYGTIARYYRNENGVVYEATSSPSSTINTLESGQQVYTFQQSLDAGLTVVEEVVLSPEEKNIISLRSKSSQINNLFRNWVTEINKPNYQHISNPYVFIENSEGKILYNYAKSNLVESVQLFADIIFNESETIDYFVKNISYFMFCHIAKDRYGNILEQIKNNWILNNYDSNGSYIAPLPETFTKKYIKEILQLQGMGSSQQNAVRQGQQEEDNFEIVNVHPNPITDHSNINISLSGKSTVSINIIKGNSGTISQILPSAILNKGNHHFAIKANDLPLGVSVCVVTINGKSYSRKILKQ